MKEKIQKWLFGKYIKNWKQKNIRIFYTSTQMAHMDFLRMGESESKKYVTHVRRDQAYKIVDMLAEAGMLTEEQFTDPSSLSTVLRTRIDVLIP